jgi:hypothetical protein
MINQKQVLALRIDVLEIQQREQIHILKEDIQKIVGLINPISIIKNAIGQSDSSIESMENTIINDVIGLSTGYITKKVIIGSSKNPIKKLAGTLFQFVVAKFVSNHAEKIHIIGGLLLNKLVRNERDTLKSNN